MLGIKGTFVCDFELFPNYSREVTFAALCILVISLLFTFVITVSSWVSFGSFIGEIFLQNLGNAGGGGIGSSFFQLGRVLMEITKYRSFWIIGGREGVFCLLVWP